MPRPILPDYVKENILNRAKEEGHRVFEEDIVTYPRINGFGRYAVICRRCKSEIVCIQMGVAYEYIVQEGESFCVKIRSMK